MLFGEVSTTEGAGYPGGLIAFLTAVEDVPDAGGNPFVSYARGLSVDCLWTRSRQMSSHGAADRTGHRQRRRES